METNLNEKLEACRKALQGAPLMVRGMLAPLMQLLEALVQEVKGGGK